MLLHRGVHAHAARDRQAVRMIGDADPRPPELMGRLRHRLDRLHAVAPRRVHLEVAQIGARGNDRRRQRRVEREPHRVAAQVGATEAAALFDFAALRRRVHLCVHGRGAARAHELGDDALARHADERDVAQRPFLDQIDDRAIDAGGERFRRALVAERAALRALQQRQILQQPGGHDVPILPDCRFKGPLSQP